MSAERVLAFVMAGGRGERLDPLTRDRTKPAVPFGGRYRIVDFVLSNLVNSSITAIYVLTQYKAQSVLEHIQRGWIRRVTGRNSFIQVVPAQMQLGSSWYRGTANAVYQNLNLLHAFEPDLVVVFGADHVYKMNIRQMVDFHLDRGAQATVACLRVPRTAASSFGVVQVDERGKIERFLEKPAEPPGLPSNPDLSLASMGNYVFDPAVLIEVLRADAARSDSTHDFGHDIFPEFARSGLAYAYDFAQNRIPGSLIEEELAYWRDVGTIETYYEANLDLKNVQPQLNLYNWKWPIMTARFNDPPAKFVFDEAQRRGLVVQSIVSPGCILAGGYAKDSVLGRNVFLDAASEVRDSILFDNVYIGPGARVIRAIIDKNVHIEAGQRVGEDLDADRERYHVSETGIVVIPKAAGTAETRERNL
ncbi:MAG TPA: glucose-1-phosphate adenylyltransferase [Candidatus Acidoferrales bacterium]|nr:glucose-1-phosphate adenylyltransferase [Candidatus Acidoferrales bacterium]